MSAGASGASTATYAILGCGSVGYAVVEELVEADKDVLIIDHDPRDREHTEVTLELLPAVRSSANSSRSVQRPGPPVAI